MNKAVLRTGLMVCATACLWPAVGIRATTLTRAEYAAHKRQIEADYKLERSACDRLTHNDKDVCIARAKGNEKVAKAELDFNNSGEEADRQRLAVAKADADRAVALERCDDRKGPEKALCVKEVEAAHSKAIADARLARRVSAAENDAAEDKPEADFKPAAAKCDALGGTSRANCIGLAKARFGKT